MNSFYNRINYKGPIGVILKNVCKEFNLGEYRSYELVPFGYEDFNLVLNTKKSTYFVKIFGSFRNKSDCERYVEVMKTVFKRDISYPFLYTTLKKEHLYKIKLGKSVVRLVVQQYIDGKNFIQLKTKPTEKEKEFIIHQAALIHKINLKPQFVYDSFAVVNFEKEFEKRNKVLPKILRKEIQSLLNEFISAPIQKLPYCFVHGDIIASNVMKDKDGKLYIIDFAVSNYYPRIVELSALICFNFFDPDSQKSLRESYNFTLETYQKFTKLEDIEQKFLPLFIKASFAMYLLRAQYEKVVNTNTSEENQHWLRVGSAGLSSSLRIFT